MKIIKYPDSSSYVKEEEFLPKITFRVNTYEDLWHLNQYVDVCNHNGYIPTIIIPNLIDAQADRRFNKNESSGLKLVLNFLNKINASFKIFHPHNPEVVEAIMNNVEIMDNSEFILRVLNLLNANPIANNNANINNTILMSSDAGGFKPLSKLCDKLGWKGEMYSASKARSWDEVDGTKFVQQIDRQDFQGKDILIIDDICVYGKTFKGLSKLLREKNCGKLYLAISHMTVQNLGVDSVTDYFDSVFCTNSKFDKYFSENSDLNNLQIINLF